MRDPYQVLGVARGASDAEIKKAFRQPRQGAAPGPQPGGSEGAGHSFSELNTRL